MLECSWHVKFNISRTDWWYVCFRPLNWLVWLSDISIGNTQYIWVTLVDHFLVPYLEFFLKRGGGHGLGHVGVRFTRKAWRYLKWHSWAVIRRTDSTIAKLLKEKGQKDECWFGFWCLTPLSAMLQLYHGDQF